ncbi:MAG: lamin tail domain-containing protein, partial [Sphingobacteriaceae bacterium]|nr:lamin tail domain-containing protein [Sphingobacteriaceae bacterium]
MRKIVFVLCFLFAKCCFSQLNDNFSDADFVQNPIWLGNTSFFTINANQQLQSGNSSVAQTIYLSTENQQTTNAQWTFFVQLNFDPSTSNLTRIYLASNQQDLTSALNGYFIQIGENGATDSFDLFKQTGTSIVKIIDGAAKTRANANVLNANIKVTRDDTGKWELYTDNTGGTNYVLEGTSTDNTHLSANWFGVYCKYTATRSNGFIFDNFSITELVSDTTPPTLTNAKAIDETHVEVTFSEALDLNSALLTNNYSLTNSVEKPIEIKTTSLPNVFVLRFQNALNSGNYTLEVNQVSDKKLNPILPNNRVSFFYLQPYTAQKGDVIINEIFADPSPVIGLPASEFVELWNTTDKFISLKNWKYSDQSTAYTFAEVILEPKQLLVLCPVADVNLYNSFGKTLGLSSWPSLNNDKDVLTLSNPQSEVIDQVSYVDTWYKDSSKKLGGYTLELINPKSKCGGVQNWAASKAPLGGTPATQNSIYLENQNTEKLSLSQTQYIDSKTIQLHFNQSIDSSTANVLNNFTLKPHLGAPSLVQIDENDLSLITLKWNSEMQTNTQYQLEIKNIANCEGELMETVVKPFFRIDFYSAQKGDVIINEIFADPSPVIGLPASE